MASITNQKTETPKRLFMFATYYQDGVISDSDIYYLQQMHALGDVWFCADCDYISDSELDKIRTYCDVVISERHGAYDFGSWALLVKKQGYKKLQGYDEVILCNNSVFLVGDLKKYLDTFKTSPEALFCTVGIVDEHYNGMICKVKDFLDNGDFVDRSAMFPSFFWMFRKELLNKHFVRHFLHSVKPEKTRLDVCNKYERGFSRSIIRHNIPYATAIDTVYRTSWVYREPAFQLVKDGFPFLKKKIFAQEFYKIRHLSSLTDSIRPFFNSRIWQFVQKESIEKASEELKTSSTATIGTELTSELRKKFEKTFDTEFYASENPDIKDLNEDALRNHFLVSGFKEGRAPNSWFPNKHYVKKARDDRKPPEFNPFLHYLRSVNDQQLDEIKIISNDFDADYYLAANPDVARAGLDPVRHFVDYGWKEMRNPNSWFITERYMQATELTVDGDINPFSHYLKNGWADQEEYNRVSKDIAQSYGKARRLIIYCNVARNLVSGGMLSINRFVRNTEKLFADNRDTEVAVVGVPLGLQAINNDFYEEHKPMVELSFLAKHISPDEVILHIPENFAEDFARSLSDEEQAWLSGRPKLTINIMNQNFDLMPNRNCIQYYFLELTNDITITTAHKRYCTQNMADYYFAGVKQLTPFLPEIKQRAFSEKEKIIMVSSDRMPGTYTGISRDSVLNMLEKQLPDFQIITVEKMSLDDYKELASKAMFSLTFGEGMDGYFIEPILGHGLAFAVFNDVFFPEPFRDSATVYDSWQTLMARIVTDIKKYAADEELYTSTSKELSSLLANYYSPEISMRELAEYYQGEYDHYPEPGSDDKVLFNNIRTHLANIMDFNFTALNNKVNIAYTPDGLVMQHFGGEFYSVLYELYVKKDYDIKLSKDEEYILIDVGMNVGATSLHLLKMYDNISRVYGYEPVGMTAHMAHHNFITNGYGDRAIIKQIGLSDSYSMENHDFMFDWSTAFSTNDKFFEPEMRLRSNTNLGSSSEIEVEVVPAFNEVKEIFASSRQKRILKCDAQGAEFEILKNLFNNGILGGFNVIVMETHFRQPTPIIDMLLHCNYQVESRLDSRKNNIHMIYAYK